MFECRHLEETSATKTAVVDTTRRVHGALRINDYAWVGYLTSLPFSRSGSTVLPCCPKGQDLDRLPYEARQRLCSLSFQMVESASGFTHKCNRLTLRNIPKNGYWIKALTMFAGPPMFQAGERSSF